MAVIEAVAVVVFVISVLVSVFVIVLVFVIVSVLVFEVVAVDAVEVVTVLVPPRMQDRVHVSSVFCIYIFVTLGDIKSTSPRNSSQQTGARGCRGRYRCCGCWLCNVDLSQVHFGREVLVELPQRCQGSIGKNKASITVPLRELLAQSWHKLNRHRLERNMEAMVMSSRSRSVWVSRSLDETERNSSMRPSHSPSTWNWKSFFIPRPDSYREAGKVSWDCVTMFDNCT